MFKRLIVTDWMNDLTVIGFAIFFVVFILTAIWALRLPRARVRHMEALPFEPEHAHDESKS